MSTPRRIDIDIAKGFAILFVVFGHLVARADPAGVAWYEPLRRAVYAFHMPFFLYLSGRVAVFSGSFFTPLSGWFELLRAKAERLLIPFFGLGLLIIFCKLAAKNIMFVDNPPAGLGEGISSLVWRTSASPAICIWYLFVLFTVSALAPLIVQGQPRRLPFILFMACLAYIIPFPEYLYLDRIGRYAVFFVVGAWAAEQDARWTAFIDRFWPFLLVILLIFLAAIAVFGAQWPPSFTLLPAGLLSMPALHGLVRKLNKQSAAVFLFLGRHSFMIYLFNTLFIGFTKAVLLHFYGWSGSHFLAFAIALMAAGTFGPIMLKHYAFQRIRLLDRLTT